MKAKTTKQELKKIKVERYNPPKKYKLNEEEFEKVAGGNPGIFFPYPWHDRLGEEN